MKNVDVQACVVSVVAPILRKDRRLITGEKTLTELGADINTRASIFFELEERTRVFLPGNKMSELDSINSIIAFFSNTNGHAWRGRSNYLPRCHPGTAFLL